MLNICMQPWRAKLICVFKTEKKQFKFVSLILEFAICNVYGCTGHAGLVDKDT